MGKAKEAWAVQFWRWRDGVEREEDADPDTQADAIFRRAPSKALAIAVGKKLARDPNNMSPGHFELQRGTPDEFSADGWDWQTIETFDEPLTEGFAELFAVCSRLVRQCGEGCTYAPGLELIAEARAALKKARGEA